MFEIADHVRIHALVAASDPDQVLLETCAQLAQRPFDPARPLWELWLLPGLPDRRVRAFLKLHHALADGPAAMAAFGALLDPTGDAPDQEVLPRSHVPSPSTGDLLHDNLRRRVHELGRGWSGVRRVARENGRAALRDFRNSVGNYPSAKDLATIDVPVVCSYGALTRSPPRQVVRHEPTWRPSRAPWKSHRDQPSAIQRPGNTWTLPARTGSMGIEQDAGAPYGDRSYDPYDRRTGRRADL